MTCRNMLAVVWCLLSLFFGVMRIDAADRPNIVLILADDIGYECVEANGSTSYKTPHLNQLAKDGMRFENCHSQPICTPTRVQIMTGLYNQRNYIRFGLLDPKAKTFGHVLRDAGYKTCIAGKWQLKGGFEGPANFGFDEYCLWQLTRRPNRYPNPGLEINGKEVDYRNGEYGPDIVTDFLCDFIEKNKEGPFFAYYPMILPHYPFEPTPDSPDWDPTARQKDKAEKGGVKDAKYFADMVAYTDKMVGKVVSKLDELDIRENTLVIFTGDNGTHPSVTSMMGDVAVPGGKGSTKDNGTHVAFIASQPGVIPKGVVRGDLVDFTDILPTLADAAKAPLPEDIPFDGHSLLPTFENESDSPRQWVYCWYERNGKRDKASRHARDQQFKLYGDGRFYDVIADPYEKSPLPKRGLSEEAKAAVRKFQPVLDRMKVDTDPA